MSAQPIDVAAYVWPSYTGDEPRSRIFWPEGIGEWQSVRNAVKKTPDHNWPRYPLWGYVNEADPYVMEMEINAAADHGVNVFIYDWYWYDRRPFLEQCLDNGFLKASNRNRMKFYLMWANHNANHLWDIRNSDDNGATVIWRADIDRKEFEIVCHRVIDNYFHLDNYYTIDGKPVFMIYDLKNLIKGLGSVQAVADAFAWFRQEAVASGLKGVHLQAVAWRFVKGDITGVDPEEGGLNQASLDSLGFDSVTNYQFVHFADMNRDYLEVLKDVRKQWKILEDGCSLPYVPHVSIGWDNNPRYRQFLPFVCKNNTPENFEKALRMAKEYLEERPSLPRLVTLNSWNEWTETSFLEPDTLYGYGYLNAVKNVFLEK